MWRALEQDDAQPRCEQHGSERETHASTRATAKNVRKPATAIPRSSGTRHFTRSESRFISGYEFAPCQSMQLLFDANRIPRELIMIPAQTCKQKQNSGMQQWRKVCPSDSQTATCPVTNCPATDPTNFIALKISSMLSNMNSVSQAPLNVHTTMPISMVVPRECYLRVLRIPCTIPNTATRVISTSRMKFDTGQFHITCRPNLIVHVPKDVPRANTLHEENENQITQNFAAATRRRMCGHAPTRFL